MDLLRDHFLLLARKGEGKSTFAAQMSPEYAVLDFDARWEEQSETAAGKSHIIKGGEVVDVIDRLRARKPKLQGRVGTVIVDSGTTMLDTMLAGAGCARSAMRSGRAAGRI